MSLVSVTMFVHLHHVHHVSGQFNISRSLVTLNRMNYPIDFVIGGESIFQRRAGRRNTREDLALRGEIAYPMMQ